MIPIDFVGSNVEIEKNGENPFRWERVRAFSSTEKGRQFYIFAFKPNAEDIRAILAGEPIMLQLYATPAWIPVFNLFTINPDTYENNNG